MTNDLQCPANIGTCRIPGEGRRGGWCHVHDPNGTYQQKYREQQAAKNAPDLFTDLKEGTARKDARVNSTHQTEERNIMGFDWDRAASDSIKFDKPGDEAIGDIVLMEWQEKASTDGTMRDVIKIVLKVDNDLKVVWAGQKNLIALLGKEKPEVGDRIKIRFVDETDLGGGRRAKNFTVTVKRGMGAPVEAPAMTAAEDDDF